jgi:hypothetical protein
MTKMLELLGLRKSANSVELFRTWHSYVALAIGAAVVIAVHHLA